MWNLAEDIFFRIYNIENWVFRNCIVDSISGYKNLFFIAPDVQFIFEKLYIW